MKFEELLSNQNFKYLTYIIISILIIEFIFSILVIKFTNYTEIDWIAYMQEVEGFLSGERNYSLLKGDTGPLVYPAGFLYVFAFLRYLTSNGTDVRTGQYIFLVIYIFVLALVLNLYKCTKNVPLYSWLLLILSKRVHSIFLLRMFNDCIAILFGYASLLLFINQKWKTGSLLYSIAVSVKMNMLLWAPGILLVYILSLGFKHTIKCLFICAGVQLILGYPFLSTYPLEYISNSFNLGRSFIYKWTVNLKFLPEEIFLNKKLSVLLLFLTILFYALFAHKFFKEISFHLNTGNSKKKSDSLIAFSGRKLEPDVIIFIVFVSNFIGIVFARSLHYQFYAWYFHMLPYLLWKCNIPNPLRFICWLVVELAFNTFPSTAWSSLLLSLVHVFILLKLYFTPSPTPLFSPIK